MAGALAAPDKYKTTLNLPAVTVKDISRITASLGALATALIAARDGGLISHETAMKAWAKVLAELDIEIDPATELEAVAREERERELQRQQQQNNALQQLMAQQANGQQPRDEQPMSDEDMRRQVKEVMELNQRMFEILLWAAQPNGQQNGQPMPGEEMV
jgi:hypothetical protein